MLEFVAGCIRASAANHVCSQANVIFVRVVGVRLPTLSSESAFQKTDSRLLVFHRRTRLFWTPDSLPRHERRTPDSRISPQRDPSQPKNGTPDSDSDSTPGVLLESDSDNSNFRVLAILFGGILALGPPWGMM